MYFIFEIEIKENIILKSNKRIEIYLAYPRCPKSLPPPGSIIKLIIINIENVKYKNKYLFINDGSKRLDLKL